MKEARMSKIAPMYLYATEMVSSYYKKLNLKNKKILTICGSGDQVINAYFFGAKKVMGFDLNERSEFITRLKIVAIKNFSYKEFLDFFTRGDEKSFDYEKYKSVAKNLNLRTKKFFDEMYEKYEFSGKKLSSSELFRERKDFKKNWATINSYLKNKKNYIKLKGILKETNFEFIQMDIKDIGNLKKKGFDLVNLSNAPNYFLAYLKRKGIKERVEYFYKNVLSKFKGKLSKNGLIFLYVYSDEIYPNRIAKKNSPFSKKSVLRKMETFGEFKISEIYFKGTDESGKDRIVILEKTQTKTF